MPESGEFFTSHQLSESANGEPILVAGTAIGSSTKIHDATSESDEVEFITLYACNTHASTAYTITVVITSTHDGGTSPDDVVSTVSLSPTRGSYKVLEDHPVAGGLVIDAFAGATNVITIHGNKKRMQR